MSADNQIFVGISGASGVRYGMRCVSALLELGWCVDLCLTSATFKVLETEEGLSLAPDRPDEIARLFGASGPSGLRLWRNEQIEAPAASGSALRRGAVVIPCSMGTLARVAHGFSGCLIERACDVALKEGRPLVIVPRETPLSTIHLENMLSLARAGAAIVPASPGFYHRPQTIEDLVDHVVGKVLDRLGIAHELFPRWQGPGAREGGDE